MMHLRERILVPPPARSPRFRIGSLVRDEAEMLRISREFPVQDPNKAYMRDVFY